MITWFLLYDGTSEDGRGLGYYCGRTTDAKLAKLHYDKCRSSSYNTGYVDIVTDNKLERASSFTDWNSYESN